MLDSEILRYWGLKLGLGSESGVFEIDLFGKGIKGCRWFLYE